MGAEGRQADAVGLELPRLNRRWEVVLRWLLLALPSLCFAGVARAEPTLAALGTICWNRDALPADAFDVQRKRLGEQCLIFSQGTSVTSYNYLAGAREGFSDDDGTYSATGDRLTIEHPGGWEAWGDERTFPSSVTCRYEITGKNSLVLSECPLAGEWSR